MSLPVYADVYMIEFDLPTSRVDGTYMPPSETAGYRVVIDGIEQAIFYANLNNTASDVIEYEILSYGRHDIQLIARDTDGRESAYSEIFSVVVNASPNPPVIKMILRK